MTIAVFTTACFTSPPNDIDTLGIADLESASAVVQFSHNRYAKGPFKPKRSFAGMVNANGEIELYKMGRIATSRPLWDEHGRSLIDQEWLYVWNHQFQKFPAENGDSVFGRVRIKRTGEALWLTNEGFVDPHRYLVRAITARTNTPHYQFLSTLASCESEVFALAADFPEGSVLSSGSFTELTVRRIWKNGNPDDETVISGLRFSDHDDMISDDDGLWCRGNIIKGIQPQRSQGDNRPTIKSARLYIIDIANRSIDFLDLTTPEGEPVENHSEYSRAIYGGVDGEHGYWATSDGAVWSTNLNDGVSRLIVAAEPESEARPKHAREVSFQRDHVAVFTRYYRDDDDSGAIIRWYSLADGRQLNEIEIPSLGAIERQYDISMSGFATNPRALDSR